MTRLLCAAILTVAASAQTYTIKTFAGGALPENVPGISASLGEVYGVAADKTGNLFLALGDYNIVVRLDAGTGVLTRVAGTGADGFSGDNGPALNAQLSGPTGLAVDAAGNLYIADANNFRIRMVTPKGVITTVAGNGVPGYSGDNGPATSAEFDGLADIAVDLSGSLYIADFYNQVIRKVSSGKVYTVVGNGTYGYSGDNGPPANAQLAGPSGVALDATGNLYIAEGYNNRIRKVSNGLITTVAGNGTAGFGGDKGPATGAMLKQPAGVAIDAAGTLYIADYGNNRIRAVSNGIITTMAGSGAQAFSGDHVAATSAGLGSPQHIAADSSGNLYIVDGGRIRKVASGVITTMAGGGPPAGENGPATGAQILSPQGIAVDSAGNVYIADQGTGRVLKVAGGVITTLAGSDQFSAPYGIAVDSSGNVFVADSQNARVRKIANEVIATVAGGGAAFGDNGPATSAQLSNPQGLALDSGGNIYVTDLNRVRAIKNGVITTVAGNGTLGYQGDNGLATAAVVSNPSGVALDPSGNLFIADYGNNRIRMVSNGIVTTVAGNGNYGFSVGNGQATSATLGAPSAVAADSSGDLYITDDQRVLKITKGKIATIAGLSAPQGIAVDASGNVYVADPANHRVAILTPSGTSCAVSVNPASLQSPAAGGSLALGVQTGSSCPWTVENLPDWITVSGSPSATGPATVTLVIDNNTDAPRSATILAGGQNVVVAQAGSMTILGQVTLTSGAPLSGVNLALTGSQTAATTTGSGGSFSFSGFSSTGAYTVTPSLAGYSFVPPSLTFTNAAANPTANFVAWPLPRVAGFAPVYGSALQPAPNTFAAGEIASIYGADLCSTPASANPTLPDRLAGCMIRVDGAPVRIYYGSPVQINVVLPQNLTLGAHRLVVQRYADSGYKQLAAESEPLSFTVSRVAMAIVERKEGAIAMLLAQYPDGGLAGENRPLKPGDTITLYLTGLGRKVQTFAEGAAPKVASAAVETIQVLIQGQPAKLLYAGVQPQYPGLDQISLQLPAYTLPAGKYTVTIEITAPSAGQTLRYELNSR